MVDEEISRWDKAETSAPDEIRLLILGLFSETFHTIKLQYRHLKRISILRYKIQNLNTIYYLRKSHLYFLSKYIDELIYQKYHHVTFSTTY